ncbi:MAG: tol-pal system-associated acyl-CoA thioesterase [Xanthomonadaceae bacterium]|nr:tol-pal system-associated acyl-CoA thioesterase [Xanthomonadaceae bacterium]MBU6477110.1 tol-pal system-associated acyl-CoA thioesterase [Xanthomonadaceae bacterium]MDE2223652.1 tol-pal system-associated acyl-CoA thioesterase [Xanthomonadaceae bacterium]MDE2496730.1 tol-pal system-associated acyl-CoA thioesterase [Xanthomonadaceae bacterium]
MVDVTGHAQRAFRWRTRVYWEDTDAGGVVYHAGYLRFLERARSEWMRAAAIGQDALRQSHGIVFVVRELSIAYDKPARLDDELDSTVRVERLRAASIDFAQVITRVGDCATLARATVRVACIDAGSFAPCRIPQDIAALIEGNNFK